MADWLLRLVNDIEGAYAALATLAVVIALVVFAFKHVSKSTLRQDAAMRGRYLIAQDHIAKPLTPGGLRSAHVIFGMKHTWFSRHTYTPQARSRYQVQAEFFRDGRSLGEFWCRWLLNPEPDPNKVVSPEERDLTFNQESPPNDGNR